MKIKRFKGPRTRLTASQHKKLLKVIDSYVNVSNFCSQHDIWPKPIYDIVNDPKKVVSRDLANRLIEIVNG